MEERTEVSEVLRSIREEGLSFDSPEGMLVAMERIVSRQQTEGGRVRDFLKCVVAGYCCARHGTERCCEHYLSDTC